MLINNSNVLIFVNILCFLEFSKKRKKFCYLCVQMSIVFSEDGLKDAAVPCIAQTFVNHNAQLFKIYVLGKEQFVVKRPSIKNIYAGSKQT